jgi:UPF0755 protein
VAQTPLSSSAPLPDPGRPPRWHWRSALLIGAASVAALSAVGGWRYWTDVLQRPGSLPETTAIVAPRGGTRQLSDALAAAGVIDRPWLFRAAAWLTRGQGTLHAAEFVFPSHVSVQQVLVILRSGHPVEHHFTIAEGLTGQQIAGLLAHAEAMTGEVRTIEEGAVLPQTYDYEFGADRARLVARARAAMDKELDAAWAGRAPGSPLTSPRDALILASIVERETAKPEERPHVAAVYLNRLRLGMKLQADPTVAYLASGGSGVLDHRLTRAELGRDDPFNTYRSPGLPPAPICSPGLDTVLAVLHPAASDDLFFVADGTGGHVFSRSNEAHEVAVARWRAQTQPPPHASPD